MSDSSLSLGRLGESAAVVYLKSQNFHILDRNVHLAIGEIDIIASKGPILYFMEVKTRKNTVSGNPYEAVDARKAKKLILMGEKYSLQKKLNHSKLALGVVSVLVSQDNKVTSIKLYDYFI